MRQPCWAPTLMESQLPMCGPQFDSCITRASAEAYARRGTRGVPV